MSSNKIIVIDFGGQYAHLIARRIRELGVYSEIKLPEANLDEFKDCKGIIFSGSGHSVNDPDSPKVSKEIFDLDIPILGLCYGHQLIAKNFGGVVGNADVQEFGKAEIEIKEKSKLFEGLDKKEIVWMSHANTVLEISGEFREIANTRRLANAAVEHKTKPIYGLQFHTEVRHTVHGMKILENFVVKICKCEKNWNSEHFISDKIKEIQKQVGTKKVLVLASGGVDSTVCLGLLAKALPHEQINAFHIDMGFMRKNESAQVEKALTEIGFTHLKIVHAQNTFYSALENVCDTEEKRKIIGKKFLEVQTQELEKLNIDDDNWLLCQGTIYPDIIESAGTKHAEKIKTHHNRVEGIFKLIEQGKIIEPIKECYKDEVRNIGKKLDLPTELLERHPFPGPGLAIRLLCNNGKEEDFSELQTEVNQVLEGTNYVGKVLPIKSVGVQGDGRTYEHAAVIQGALDWEQLGKLSTKLTNRVRAINRVLYAAWPNQIDLLKTKKSFMSQERISLLRELDALVNDELRKEKVLKEIWQFPVVLIPVQTNSQAEESVVLRPVESTEAMTANFYKMDKNVLWKLVERLKKEKISGVFYDITNKPPATIEWE